MNIYTRRLYSVETAKPTFRMAFVHDLFPLKDRDPAIGKTRLAQVATFKRFFNYEQCSEDRSAGSRIRRSLRRTTVLHGRMRYIMFAG